MRALPFSRLLRDTFAGVLAVLMALTTVLLLVLMAVNASKGEGDASSALLVVAGCFALGSIGFFLLKRLASGAKRGNL